MEQMITLGELLVALGGSVGMVVASWVHIRVIIAKLETQLAQAIKDIDEEKESNKEHFTKLFDKIDELKSLIMKR